MAHKQPGPTVSPSPTPTPSPINLLQNNSFEIDNDLNKIPDNWFSKNLDTKDVVSNQVGPISGTKVFRFSPSVSELKESLHQSVNLKGLTDDGIIVSIYNWGGGQKIKGTTGMVITINYLDGTKSKNSLTFSKAAHKWEKSIVKSITTKPNSITSFTFLFIVAKYGNNIESIEILKSKLY